MTNFETKDSGSRTEFPSGMRRDTQDGKPRFDLLFVPGVPYEEQPLTRVAGLMARGAEKYGDHNWTLANSEEELARFKASAARHFAQWMAGETDEDHGAATWYNIQAVMVLEWKLTIIEPRQEVTYFQLDADGITYRLTDGKLEMKFLNDPDDTWDLSVSSVEQIVAGGYVQVKETELR